MQQDDEKSLYTTMRPARNGRSLVTFSTYEDRQDVLRNTNIMEDEVDHRSSRIYRNENGPPTNGARYQTPPPPPEFASSPPSRTQQNHYANNANNKFPQQKQQQKPIDYYSNSNGLTLKAPTEKPPEPPTTPIPDYDNVEITALPTKISSSVRPSYGYASTNIVTTNARDMAYDNKTNNNNNNRRISRPGTITIGEYEQPQQRREPAKFDFVGSPKRTNGTTDVSPDDLQAELQNTLTRSKLKKSAETFVEHQSDCPLRNGYENYENVVRKIHSVSINEVATVAPVRMSNGSTGNGGTNGILKNGNRHSGGGGSTKNSDKTITFGN